MGRFRVRLSDSGPPDVEPIPGLAAAGHVTWAFALGGGAHVVGTDDGSSVYNAYWLDAAGVVDDGPIAVPGCAWASWQPSAQRVVLFCETTNEDPDERSDQWVGTLAAGDDEPTLVRNDALGTPRSARQLAEYDGRAWISGSRKLLVEVDPATFAARTPRSALAPLDERGKDREHLHVTEDGRLLVVDNRGRRVEVWDVTVTPPVVLGAIPIRPRDGYDPTWDPYRRWWWIPVRGGADAIDPTRLDSPAARLDWPHAMKTVHPLDERRLAVLYRSRAVLELRVVDHVRGTAMGAVARFPGDMSARRIIALEP